MTGYDRRDRPRRRAAGGAEPELSVIVHGPNTQDDLTEIALVTDAWRDEGAAKARAAFRRRFCEFDDGRAAERVVRKCSSARTRRPSRRCSRWRNAPRRPRPRR
ncbi:hypothetical protein STENM223S_03029 [Streptomyces tendae]